MSNVIEKDQNQGYLALYEELEGRYGAAMAQEIVDQIKKADEQNNSPDYMAVKAASEVLELFRGESRQIAKKLKDAQSEQFEANIADLKEKRLEKDFQHIFDLYWLSQQTFYRLYKKAMKGCEVPATYRYDRFTRPTEMKMAA